MSRVLLTGVFYDTTLDLICQRLLASQPTAEEAPLLISGDEAEYEGETLQVFVSPLTEDGSYAMEGEYLGSMKAAEAWLRAYVLSLRRHDTRFKFDLVEEDDDGQVMGEMVSFRALPKGDRTRGQE